MKLDTINACLRLLSQLEDLIASSRRKHGHELREELLEHIGDQIREWEWQRKRLIKPSPPSTWRDTL